MSAYPTWPLPGIVSLPDLDALGPTVVDNGGQSVGIYPLVKYPGWLLKKYRTLDNGRSLQLDGLVAFPQTISIPDRSLLAASTSWPVARVVNAQGQCLGCVLPEAPAGFRVRMPIADEPTERYLEVDWLAKPDESLRARGLPVPTRAGRTKICRNVVAVAALLERHDLIYSDWSYSNAFWNPTDFSAYIIDVDGCWRGSVPNVHQPNWDDPLTPRDRPADTYTERYRVALLIGRCVTGERDLTAVLHALVALDDVHLSRLLLDILLARQRNRRPSMTSLLAVLDGLPYIRIPMERRELPPLPVSSRPAPKPVVQTPKPTPPVPTPTPSKKLELPMWAEVSAVALVVFLVVLLVVILAG